MSDLPTLITVRDIRTAIGAIALAEAKINADLTALLFNLDNLFRISAVLLTTREGSLAREFVTLAFLQQVRIIGAILDDIKALLGAIDNLKEEIRESLAIIGITPPSA